MGIRVQGKGRQGVPCEVCRAPCRPSQCRTAHPLKLADFDKQGGISVGADADDTIGPPGEPAQLDESDEKTIWVWLLYTEVQSAKARHVRKLEKERGRELQMLLCLKLGKDPDAAMWDGHGTG